MKCLVGIPEEFKKYSNKVSNQTKSGNFGPRLEVILTIYVGVYFCLIKNSLTRSGSDQGSTSATSPGEWKGFWSIGN